MRPANATLEHRQVYLKDPVTGEYAWVRLSDLAEGQRPAAVRLHAKWPIHSDAMGVLPSQIPEAQAVLAQHGVKTEYDREGRAILVDARHRRRHAEALGFYDRNGGYGDPQRK